MCRRTAAAVTFDIAHDRGESEGVGILFRRILVYFSSSRVAGSVAERYFTELRSSCSCCPSVVRCQLVTELASGLALNAAPASQPPRHLQPHARRRSSPQPYLSCFIS